MEKEVYDKPNNDRENKYRISDAADMTAQELVDAIRDKIHHVLIPDAESSN